MVEQAHLSRLIADAYRIVAEATEEHVIKPGKRLAGEVVLYSGGDDSTVLAHLFRRDADYAAHINTGIFVMDEETGESAAEMHVRATCAAWDLPLIVEHPGESYRDLVIAHGFPGPAHHFKMYQRLKERGLRKVRNRLVQHNRRERVLFIAGRRREESERRKDVPLHERDGSIVWASPLAHWTRADLNLYRKHHPDLPRNPVSAELHMSGECLCGAFAKPGELDMIAMFRPRTAAHLRQLEVDIAAAGHCPSERARWGWGAFRRPKKQTKTGPLCSSCTLWTHDELAALAPSVDRKNAS
jgi:3'-phosphoadenosine 5'-phosphosulfate sulfotransferase (PAPS reductase)/FAD synthetase